MGYLHNTRQRLASAARVVGKHALTAGKVALATAAVAGAAYNAHQTHSAVQARMGHTRGHAQSGAPFGGWLNGLGYIPGAIELIREQMEERRH